MLSDEQKTRIGEEEIFRQRVREELESHSSDSVGGRFWTFLNSSFALWFLSSVVLAGLTWLYTENQRHITEEHAKAELRKRLSTEIQFRISNAIIQNELDIRRINAGEQFTPRAVLERSSAT